VTLYCASVGRYALIGASTRSTEEGLLLFGRTNIVREKNDAVGFLSEQSEPEPAQTRAFTRDLREHPAYRPDVDGLRALAIIPVVLFHAFPSVLRGGFVGVDIFFVISGFLISSIIFKGLRRDSFNRVSPGSSGKPRGAEPRFPRR